MNLFKLSIANLKEKKLNSLLSGMLLTLGIGMISMLLLLNKQLDEQFKKNIKGIDLVIGAKGSPLQLILSSIYQIDAPTGNIPLDEAMALKANPFIKTIIPLSMGDSYMGYRIVGTDQKYIEHFEAEIESGKLFSESMDVVLGSKVAENSGLKLGDTFESSHGLDSDGDKHAEKQFKVSGILKPSGAVVDQLVITSLASVWDVHNHESEEADTHVHAEGEAHDHDHDHEEAEEKKEITSALIKFRNPMGLLTVPRQINSNTSMQAALPSIEINRLFSLLGVGMDTLKALALIIILIAAASVFISIYNSLKERKYEMALMLSLGATRTRLFLMLLFEGCILAIFGFVLGILFSRIGLWAFSNAAEQDFHYSLAKFQILPEEIYLGIGSLILALIAAAIPSMGIYRLNISRTLAED